MKSQRLTALLLCLSFFYLTTGYYALFYCQQFQVKELAVEICNSHRQNETLTLTSAEFSNLIWEDQKEVIYKGEYYDVAAVHKENGHYKIDCYHDVEEVHLVSTLKNHINHILLPSRNTKSKINIRFLFFASFSSFTEITFSKPTSHSLRYHNFLNKMYMFRAAFPTPPPEKCFV